jgi:hypothetical protein
MTLNSSRRGPRAAIFELVLVPVAGSTGFLGSHIVARSDRGGHEVLTPAPADPF